MENLYGTYVFATNLLELGMEKLLENRFEDFRISLEAGNALVNGSINESAVDNNAPQGALSIVQLASVLPAAIKNKLDAFVVLLQEV